MWYIVAFLAGGWLLSDHNPPPVQQAPITPYFDDTKYSVSDPTCQEYPYCNWGWPMYPSYDDGYECLPRE